MDTRELRALQRPLKEKYRENPQAALVTLHAEGQLADTGVSCSVRTGRQLVEAGLHEATGGNGILACSGDMLLEALAACAGVTLRAVATARGLAVTGSVRAEGDLDFRGTLGAAPDVPAGFSAIRIRFDLDTAASTRDVAELLATTERYCVVLQTLINGVAVSVTSPVGIENRHAPLRTMITSSFVWLWGWVTAHCLTSTLAMVRFSPSTTFLV